MTNRNGSGVDLQHVGTQWNREVSFIGPGFGSDHPQGIARDASGNWYITFTDSIRKYDANWNLLATRSSANAATGIAGVNHLGGAEIYNGELYATTETYTNSPYNNQHVTVWSLADLSFVRSHNISTGAHEASGLTRNPVDGHWFVTDFTSTAAIHEYDATFQYVRAVALLGGPATCRTSPIRAVICGSRRAALTLARLSLGCIWTGLI